MKNFLLICVSSLLIACGGSGGQSSDHFTVSPKGIQIRSAQPIPADIPGICDEQIDKLIERAAANGITDTRGHRAVSIRIRERSNACISPAFLLNFKCSPGPGCYDGTVFDLDPASGQVAMCAAGQYLETADEIQVTADGIRTSDIVRYEGEHWILRWSDYARYLETKYHTPTTGHPILGD